MDNISNVREDLKQLKEYRDGVEFYKNNKEEFEKPSNSIYVEDNKAYISPLNDINNHLQEENLSKVLVTNDRGAVALPFIIAGIVIIIGIVIAVIIKGV